jgi:hypothetical protein
MYTNSYTPAVVTDADLFQSIRKINKFQITQGSAEFRETLLRALKLCREVKTHASQQMIVHSKAE